MQRLWVLVLMSFFVFLLHTATNHFSLGQALEEKAHVSKYWAWAIIVGMAFSFALGFLRYHEKNIVIYHLLKHIPQL